MTNQGKLTQSVDFDRIVVSTLTEAAKTTPLHTTKEVAIPFLASLFGDFFTERISPPN